MWGQFLDQVLNQSHLDVFSRYGALPLILLLERLFPMRQTPLFGRGWLSDSFYYYEPWIKSAIFGWFLVEATKRVSIPEIRAFTQSLPLVGQFFLVFVLTELVFYVMHRMMHAIPFLWEFHRVHHSSTQYYALMTKRLHLLDETLFGFPTLSMVLLLSPDPQVAFFLVFFRRFMDLYGHSNINGPRFTGFFLVTPHFHAWHHSNHPAAMDKNFSRDTVFLDYLFGTAYYPKGQIPTTFGEPTYTTNYFRQQIQPFIEIFRRKAALNPKKTAQRQMYQAEP